MDFAIYVNRPTKTVTLHKSNCVHYKSRITQGTKKENRWSLFSGAEQQAILEQQRIAGLTDADTKICSACHRVVMDFAIYANEPTQMVTLHRQDCLHYENRKGDRTENGEWSSFSETEQQAISRLRTVAKDMQKAATAARSKKKVEAHKCETCKPCAEQDTDPKSFPNREQEILAFWDEQKVFQASLEQTKGKPPYVFYDGPPFATGLPHHGHFTASVIKDVVPRYWTMRGYYVSRRFGWDCHGLPIEHEIDKQFGMSTEEAVQKHGVKGYNDACRGIVQRYAEQWRSSIKRLGRWVDFDDDYKTMDPDFMESVWWVFKSLWDKKLIYKGTKVMPVSTALGTALSNFEANANYMDTQDPSITVLFKLKNEDAYLAAWTTTPWTLPSNLALCVGPDVDYVKVKDETQGIVLYLAEALLPKYAKKRSLQVLARCRGTQLLGRQYEPLFPYFAEQSEAGAFRVLGDAFVSTDEGTGLVHMAPAFGEEDHRVFLEAGLQQIVCPVTMQGTFTDAVTDFAHRHVLEANQDIIRLLRKQQAIYEEGTIEHAYPYCYRSDTPLIYRIIDSWFVRVTAIKDKIIKANKKVHWVPEHIKSGRFGLWLEDARDWAISRNRIWGTPLPIWINDTSGEAMCFGSVDELEAASGVRVADLHREQVDAVTFERAGEAGTYRRVPEVLDCWFESGSMPYAQLHYPFENKDTFKAGFPAEFIAEGLDQTRGWFYTLMVISAALFDQPAFKHVIVNGLVMADDGKKMSKRLGNYTPPDELMQQYGADALRLYLISSPLMKAEPLQFEDKGVRDMSRRILLPWLSALEFFKTYADIDQWLPGQAKADAARRTILDRWILSRLQTLKHKITDEMTAYRLYNVAPALLDFMNELTNWYIRLNRVRFWGAGLSADKKAAYQTLHQVLHELCQIMAPFTPFFAEVAYRRLTPLDNKAAPASVHLCPYPEVNAAQVDLALEKNIHSVQALILLGRRQREEAGIGIRTPLPKLTVIHRDTALLDAIKTLESVFKKELHIQEVVYTNREADYVTLIAKPNFPLLGKRFGKKMRTLQKAIGALDREALEAFMDDGCIEVADESLTADEITIVQQAKAGVDCLTNRHITIQMDCTVEDDLKAVGWARELVRAIQKSRQEALYQVTDRIQLRYACEHKVMREAIDKHLHFLQKETLSQATLISAAEMKAQWKEVATATAEAAAAEEAAATENTPYFFEHEIDDMAVQFELLLDRAAR